MANPRKSERLISSRGHGCFTISPPQLPATATRFPSHSTGRPGLVLQTATKLSSVGFEPTAVLTFGLRVRCLNHSATRYPLLITETSRHSMICCFSGRSSPHHVSEYNRVYCRAIVSSRAVPRTRNSKCSLASYPLLP